MIKEKFPAHYLTENLKINEKVIIQNLTNNTSNMTSNMTSKKMAPRPMRKRSAR
jgi:hypothetical protein